MHVGALDTMVVVEHEHQRCGRSLAERDCQIVDQRGEQASRRERLRTLEQRQRISAYSRQHRAQGRHQVAQKARRVIIVRVESRKQAPPRNQPWRGERANQLGGKQC